MALDPRIFPYYLKAVEPFGGHDVVQNLLTQSEIEYILTFSGFIVIVKPWNHKFDLQDYGYSPDTNYRLFNQQWELILSNRSKSGLFGESPSELNVLVESPNASFLHITFDTLDEPVCGLLWVCNQITPQDVQRSISSLQSSRSALKKSQSINEIFLSTENLAKVGSIRIYFLSRPWESQIRLTDFISDSKTTIVNQETAPIIVLYPERSGWYLITHVINNVAYPLIFRDITGVGVRRIRSLDEGSFYLDFSNRHLTPPLIYGNAFPTDDSTENWLNADNKIRLNADLIYSGATMKANSSSNVVIEIDEFILLESVGKNLSSMTYVPLPKGLASGSSDCVVL